MKKISLLIICLIALSCSRGAEDGVTFNVVQPIGQKSTYAITNQLTMETAAPEMAGGPQQSKGVLTAVLDAEVTSRQTNGNWTMSNKFTSVDLTVDGESMQQTTSRLQGKSFTVTLNDKGDIVGVSGIENLVPGMDVKQMLTQMNPSMMLPSKPVKVGESWPIELSNPTDVEGVTVNQTLKGTGTLRELNGALAVIDFVYKLDMSMSGGAAERMRISGSGEGKSTVSYDVEKARFTSNTTTMKMETVGQMGEGQNAQEIKNTLTSSLQVDLVNK